MGVAKTYFLEYWFRKKLSGNQAFDIVKSGHINASRAPCITSLKELFPFQYVREMGVAKHISYNFGLGKKLEVFSREPGKKLLGTVSRCEISIQFKSMFQKRAWLKVIP